MRLLADYVAKAVNAFAGAQETVGIKRILATKIGPLWERGGVVLLESKGLFMRVLLHSCRTRKFHRSKTDLCFRANGF